MELLQNTNLLPTQVNWPTIIASLGAALISVIALATNYYLSKITLNEKRFEERRAFLKKQLNDFYGPLILLREKSNTIYKKFRHKFYENDPNFSTLSYLLDNYEFEENDKSLLSEIINIGTKCENLIHKNAGLIDDLDLRDNIIPKATTHFLLIRLAFEKKIKGRSDEFRDLTFPRELDEKLKSRKLEIQNELTRLLS